MSRFSWEKCVFCFCLDVILPENYNVNLDLSLSYVPVGVMSCVLSLLLEDIIRF